MRSNHRSAVDGRPLSERMRAYGCPDLIPLDEPPTSPAQIEYLDLLPRRGSSPASLNAVAEHQGTALLYVLDAGGDMKADTARIGLLQRQLANRSDPAWLGIARPGSLELHPIGFGENPTTFPAVTIEEQDTTAPLFFQSLVHGVLEENDRLKGTDYVFKKIFGLLEQTIHEYVGTRQRESRVQPLDVLSMAGRALFFRFLIDRRIVIEKESRDICPAADGLKDTFANAEKAAQTSAWLDETFNGDFLQLIDESIPATDRAARQAAYLRFYKTTERRAGRKFFHHLHAILNGWKATGDGMQLPLDWGDLDFAHIPVGVLSQVYESFSHRADHRSARETSIHYTPRTIARLMVDQTFAAARDPAHAKILDPACGAGIFLVLAFRRLVSERWRSDGRRPTTRTIQSILYNQVRGFEISESALRLAALSLYITAIEVNGTQRPPKALKFPRGLRDEVLYYFGDDPDNPVSAESPGKSSFTLGSLGPDVPGKFDGFFDIVIGNPPWTRLREKEPQSTDEKFAARARTESDVLNDKFTDIGRRVLQERGFSELASVYENPDKNPDLPFVWRATEWARTDGMIAFALPARIFGRTTGKGYETWRAILRGISITGLINGSDLRKTAVWEAVDMPFCLLFARNALPTRDHRFQYASPLYEPNQHRHARFRIDYEATRPISAARVEKEPWVLKALALGTWRDVRIVQQLRAAFPRKLGDVWKDWNPEEDKTGKGYDRSPGLKQKHAKFLGDLLDFNPPPSGFAIQYGELKTYLENHGKHNVDVHGHATAYRPKTKELYRPPLVIVRKAPGEHPETPKAFIAKRAIAFSQSYYGYSCAGHPKETTLAALLFLIAHSNLLRYFVLMMSVSQGSDHMIFTKQDLDRLSFPDVSELPTSEKKSIRSLARRLERDRMKPWQEIDDFLFRLYGLDEDAAQVAEDTIFASASYRRAGRAALERTMRRHRNPFRSELRETLDPYFDVCDEEVLVEETPDQPDTWIQPWFFLAISRAAEPVPVNAALLRKAMKEANRRSASRIVVKAHGRRGLLLGLLNQRRWWTITRARLCGQHIVRHHLDAFGLTQQA
ncbi:MAG: N-6 DNA methylase [bacterium]|nr:N-6 DNA methylase [bacterium]